MTGVVGFIGLGRMGYAMAGLLREKGYELVVWNRTRGKAEAFAEKYGARVAASPAQVAEEASVIHVMVADDEASRTVILGPRGILEGAREGLLVVEHSTITPGHSVFLWKVLGERRVGYAEAPVIGGPRRAAAGELLVLVAGDRRGLEESSVFGETLWLGEVPRASAAKLAFNSMLFTVIAGMGEAAALLEAYGMSFEWFAEKVLSKTFLRAIVERYGSRPFDPGYQASFAARLAAKDQAYFVEALRAKGLPGTHAASIQALYSLMDSLGWGDADYTHLALFLRSLARGETVLGKKTRGL